VKKNISRIIGKIGQERGRRTEDRFTAAFKGVAVPKWCHCVAPATPEQEGQGIDKIMWTDVGPVYIQLKSSRRGKQEHQRHYPRRPIGVVILNSDDSDETIRQKALSAAGELRKRFLNKRVRSNRNPSNK